MKIFKNKVFVYIMAFVICGILAFVLYEFFIGKDKKSIVSSDEENIGLRNSAITKLTDSRGINVIINNVTYNVTLEDNLTVEDIIALDTIILNAEDESLGYKYAYLNNSITYSPEYTGKILKGDLLLYDSNCIVLYYQDMDTDKVYTKIGHVENLDTLEFGPIDIIIKAK